MWNTSLTSKTSKALQQVGSLDALQNGVIGSDDTPTWHCRPYIQINLGYGLLYGKQDAKTYEQYKWVSWVTIQSSILTYAIKIKDLDLKKLKTQVDKTSAANQGYHEKEDKQRGQQQSVIVYKINFVALIPQDAHL